MTIVSGLFLIVAVLLTSTLSGVFGMVGGMVLLWLLLLVMPVSTAIAVQGILQLVANCSRAYFARKWLDWRILWHSTLGLAGAVILLVLLRYTPNIAVVSVCVGLLPIAVWLPVRWIRLDAAKPLHAIACGFVSGGLNIGVGVAGPIVDIFFIRTAMDRRKVIATKASLQVLSHVAKIVFYAGSLWSLPSSSLVAIGLAAPFSVLGSIIGHHILVRMTDHGFRRGTRWLVTVVGAFYFIQGLYLLVT